MRNAEFLNEKIVNVLKGVEQLIDDVLHHSTEMSDDGLSFYLFAILEPIIHGAYIDLLIGNLPAYFMELRLLLESLAYCYMARIFPKDYPLEKIYQKNVSVSKLLKEFGEMIDLDDEPIKLWGELSNNWCHALQITKNMKMKGIIGRAIEHFAEHAIPPIPSIPLPYEFFEEETLPLLHEAEEMTSKFRKVLWSTTKWRNST
ncbi:MAG: hypothetical protein QXH67_00800 [Candidatus Bathyarchaeia archaeon]